MRKSIRYLTAVVAVSVSFVAMTKPVCAQSLLERLEDRVRQRLGGEEPAQREAPQQTPEASAQSASPATQSASPMAQSASPMAQSGSSMAPVGRVTLGLEAEERGFETPYEIIIVAVRPGTAAASAGLKAGDLLTTADGETIGSIDQLAGVVRTKTFGDSLKLGILRQGESREVVVRFVAAPGQSSSASNAPRNATASPQSIPTADQPIAQQPGQPIVPFEPSGATQSNMPPVVERPTPGSGRMGVTVENATTTPPGPGVPVKRGAVVVGVDPTSPAGFAGIQQGDVIVSIDGVVIRDAAALIEEVSKTRPGQNVELGIYQGEKLAKLTMVLAAPSELGQAAGQPSSASPMNNQPLSPQPTSQPTPQALPNQEASGGLLGTLGGFFGGNRAAKQPVPSQPSATQPTDPPVLNQTPAMIPETGRMAPTVIPPLPTTEPIPDRLPAAGQNAPIQNSAIQNAPSQDEVQQLKDEIDLLRRQLEAMQQRLNQLEQQKPLEPTPLPTSG